MGLKKKVKKATKSKAGKAKKGGLLASVASKIPGMKGKGVARGVGGRRRRGPEYWARKVLVERLKKRYWRIKYGGKS